MDISLLAQGIGMGFAIGAVVGPIALLCIQHALAEGIWAGFAVGLGAALADSFYGGVAAFGLTSLCNFLLSYQTPLAIAGGLYLIYLGYSTFLSVPDFTPQEDRMQKHGALVLSTFFLTVTSPVTILAFVALFANLPIYCMTYITALLLTFGVFIGSMLWWVLLVAGSHLLKTKLGTKHLYKINKLSGIVLALFGAAMIIKQLIA